MPTGVERLAEIWVPAVLDDGPPWDTPTWTWRQPVGVPAEVGHSYGTPGDTRPGHYGEPLGHVYCLRIPAEHAAAFRAVAVSPPLEALLIHNCMLSGRPDTLPAQDAIADRLRAEAARVPMDERRKAMMARTLHQLMLRGLPADRTLEIAREVGADTADADGPVDTDLRGL